MFTTLDHLEQQVSPLKKIWKEIRIFVIIFVIIFFVSNVAVNAQLYQYAFLDLVEQWTGSSSSNTQIAYYDQSTPRLSQQELAVQAAQFKKQSQMKRLAKSIDGLARTTTIDFVGEHAITSHLEAGLNSYDLEFNTLPPSDRVIIPKINVNTPLLQSSFTKNIEDITKDDFDKDLYHGVVQYPTTPFPGMGGNTLIFGHTSYESRKHNPYGTIFRQMPKLDNGDIMQIVRDGKLYEYTVISKTITSPHNVNEEYLKYSNGDYLTLLGCYPIGSDKQRILVVGKLTTVY